MGNSKNKHVGLCKLTGDHGPFVKSHLIPRALTRLSLTGEKYIEAEIGQRSIRRPDSWYDTQLVTAKGEKILEAIDTVGIELLRQHQLIWSAWDGQEFGDGNSALEGARMVSFRRPEELQLFFLSLAWRAAASNLKAFRTVQLEESVLEDLRTRVLKMKAGAFHDYPVILFQLVTKGASHNRTPLLEDKEWPLANGTSVERIPYIRFYFDGLVAHIQTPNGVESNPDMLRVFTLGGGDPTGVVIHPFEKSRTLGNLETLVRLSHPPHDGTATSS